MGTAGAACLSAEQLHLLSCSFIERIKQRHSTSTLAIFISVSILPQLDSAVCYGSTSMRGSVLFLKMEADACCLLMMPFISPCAGVRLKTSLHAAEAREW